MSGRFLDSSNNVKRYKLLRLSLAIFIAALTALPSFPAGPAPAAARGLTEGPLLEPPDGAQVTSLTPLFRWVPNGFTQILVEQADGAGSPVSWVAAPSLDRGTPPTPLTPGAAYRWRIRFNPDSPSRSPQQWGEWSESFSFRVAAPSAVAPAATTVTAAPPATATEIASATPAASATPTPTAAAGASSSSATPAATPSPRPTGAPVGRPPGPDTAQPLWPQAAQGLPPDTLSLEDQGYVEQIVRGSSVTIDMYFPGAGRFKTGEKNSFTLALAHSEIVDPAVSTITVLVNEVPQLTWFLTPNTARLREVTIPLPSQMLKPDLNKVELRFIMRLPRDGCADTSHPALSATIFRQTRIHYDFLPGYPRTPWDPPDLARFPETLLEPSAIQSNLLMLVVPDNAEMSDLRAAMNVAGAVGRRVGGRSVIMRLVQASEARSILKRPGGSNVIVIAIGQPAANRLWDDLGENSRLTPIPLIDRASGQFRGFDGQPIRDTDGVLMDIPSPWNADFRAVLVSGATEEAVTRAAFALASDTSRRALQGEAGVITERPVDPNQAAIAGASEILSEFTLADLGFLDRTVNGWGVHELNASFDSSGVPARGARADVVFDHSNVLNSEMSSVSVSLNNIPLSDVRLNVGISGRKNISVPFPARVLKTGRNVLTVRFQFTAPNSGTPIKSDKETGEAVYFCGSPPADLAWAVLYADSTIVLPPGATGSAGLGSFPFPFIREGRNSNTFLVFPDDLREAVLAPELAATLGRTFTTDLVDLPVVTASKLTAELRQNSHLIVFGLPWANPVVTEIGPSLPLAIDERGRVVQQPNGPLAAVKDLASMGILETIPSPFNPRRAIMVVSGTAADSLGLALKALDQGGIFGNLAIAQAPEGASKSVRTRLFDIAVAAPAPPPLVQVREAIPGALTAAAVLGAVALLTVTGLARVRATRRRAQEADTEVSEDWLEVLEADEFARTTGAGPGATR